MTDLGSINYKNELYVLLQVVKKRYSDSCKILQRKRKLLPDRDSDMVQNLEWTLAKQQVSRDYKEKEKVETAYNSYIRGQLSPEDLGIPERLSIVHETIDHQREREVIGKAVQDSGQFDKIIEAARRYIPITERDASGAIQRPKEESMGDLEDLWKESKKEPKDE